VHAAILDSTVYIDHWRGTLSEDALRQVQQTFIIRHSSVVLSELRRGARTRDAQGLVEGLFKLARIQWPPTSADWWEAGRLIRKIGNPRGWDPTRRLRFQNDVLIALTARRQGATIVTSNRADFDLLAREIGVSVLPLNKPS